MADMENSIGAATMAAVALNVSLLNTLKMNGVISTVAKQETIDRALLMLEEMQAQAPHLQEMFELSRSVVALALRAR